MSCVGENDCFGDFDIMFRPISHLITTSFSHHAEKAEPEMSQCTKEVLAEEHDQYQFWDAKM
jgi:hypothetical protein